MNGKVAIITGGTSGIGLKTAEKMAGQGAIVIAAARKERMFDNPNIKYHYVDVTDKESCRKLLEFTATEYGKVDILIAGAGITTDALTAKITDNQFDTVIDVNLKGVFNVVRYIGPYMEKQGWGSIVVISSIVGELGNIGQVNYSASKGAVISMAKTWAKEFSRKGTAIRVNAVAPGYVMTRMLESVPNKLLEKFAGQTMLKRLGKPEEIANVITFLASDEASYVTGTVIDVNGGLRL